MSWMGWVFDFYDLTLYTFLLIPIGKELNFSSVMLSYFPLPEKLILSGFLYREKI